MNKEVTKAAKAILKEGCTMRDLQNFVDDIMFTTGRESLEVLGMDDYNLIYLQIALKEHLKAPYTSKLNRRPKEAVRDEQYITLNLRGVDIRFSTNPIKE